MRPITGPLTRSPSGGVTGVVGGAALSAFSAAKFAIQQDSADVNILVIGDSTGNAIDEWVYLFGQWLETEYPTHAVSYRLWNDAGNVYDAAVSLGTGTGANTIRIWNASVAGTSPIYMLGGKFQSAIVAPNPSLVIWNHGHNLIGTQSISGYLTRGELLGAMDQVRLALPSASHAYIKQNPRRDDSQLEPVLSVVDSVTNAYGEMRRVDAYTLFIAQAKSPSLYADNTHPNAAGTQLILDAVKSAWRLAPALPQFATAPAFLAASGENLIANSDFDSPYAGGIPSGWTAQNTPALTADTAIKDAGASQSLKITGTAAGAAIYFQVANVSSLRGQAVTLAVRQYVPAGGAATVGRIGLLSNNGSTSVVVNSVPNGNIASGAFRWIVIAGFVVQSDAQYIRAYLFCDTAANASSAAYYDRAILVAGDLPRNLA